MNNSNTKCRVDILNIEIESLSLKDKPRVALGCAYYALGRANRVKMLLPVTDETKMTALFYKTLLENLSDWTAEKNIFEIEDYEIAKKNQLEDELKNFFLKIKAGIEKARSGKLSDFDYAMIVTNRLDFYNPEYSLSNKSLREKVEILLRKARGDIQDKYYIPAKDLLEKILVLNDDNKEAFALLGVCHRELGELEKAEKAFKRWLELSEPDEPKPYFNYGDVLINLKKYAEAEKVFEAFLRVFPSDFNGLLELAQVKCFKGDSFADHLLKAQKIDSEGLRRELLTSFVFTSEDEDLGEQMDHKLAAAFLSAEPEVIRDLFERGVIPHRAYDDEIIFYEKELIKWAQIANAFDLFAIKFKIDMTAVERLKSVRKILPAFTSDRRQSRSSKTAGRGERRKKLLEDLGQQTLFEE
jgi:tetratricopeptide (TPR) repeat protein